MTTPTPAGRWPTLDLPYAEPASRTPRWRRIVIAALIGGPAMALVVADVVDAAPASLSTGVALCTLWLSVLARSIMPLARVARWLEAVCAAASAAAALTWAGVDWTRPLPALAVAAAFASVALLRRMPRRTAAPPAAPLDEHGASHVAVAFSEASANPRQAALIAVCCVAFAGAGVLTAITVGPVGWWYVVAAAVWVTGSAPWTLRVTVDRSGIVVRSLVLPGELVRVPLDDAARVDAVLVLSNDWGGVGCLVDGGATSILRGDGAALLVTRVDGTQVVVNVERPDEAVAAFAALRRAGAST